MVNFFDEDYPIVREFGNYRHVSVQCKNCKRSVGDKQWFVSYSRTYWHVKLSDVDWEINFQYPGGGVVTCDDEAKTVLGKQNGSDGLFIFKKAVFLHY